MLNTMVINRTRNLAEKEIPINVSLALNMMNDIEVKLI